MKEERENFSLDYVTFRTFHNSLVGKFLHTTSAWCSSILIFLSQTHSFPHKNTQHGVLWMYLNLRELKSAWMYIKIIWDASSLFTDSFLFTSAPSPTLQTHKIIYGKLNFQREIIEFSPLVPFIIFA